ncbi:uncharacterized protein LOC125495719 [Beta vulgaris subsp. vulgaris]|uniref:uncharacterized protein LOC125495719 n=1 Tax=Beta vulgaris subsp. vulgaris TaxID=3555 RepID=UPI00203717A7|nr:uncharacterized protein LOC125495719 [Beta vulgaris subsp. vulgaris]
MALGAKNKLVFIDGKLPKPPPNSDDYRFWDDLVEKYGKSNAPQLYSIMKEMTGLTQNEMSVADYYGKLKKFWDELNVLNGFPECSCDVLKDSKYDSVREGILAMDTLPTINKAFHLVQQAEKQKEISENIETGSEASALFSNKGIFSGIQHTKGLFQNMKGGMQRKESKEEKMKKYFCDHYKMKGQTREGCFKLIGYPYCNHYNMKGKTKEGCFKIHGYQDKGKGPVQKGRRNLIYAGNAESKEENKN